MTIVSHTSPSGLPSRRSGEPAFERPPIHPAEHQEPTAGFEYPLDFAKLGRVNEVVEGIIERRMRREDDVELSVLKREFGGIRREEVAGRELPALEENVGAVRFDAGGP